MPDKQTNRIIIMREEYLKLCNCVPKKKKKLKKKCGEREAFVCFSFCQMQGSESKGNKEWEENNKWFYSQLKSLIESKTAMNCFYSETNDLSRTAVAVSNLKPVYQTKQKWLVLSNKNSYLKPYNCVQTKIMIIIIKKESYLKPYNCVQTKIMIVIIK